MKEESKKGQREDERFTVNKKERANRKRYLDGLYACAKKHVKTMSERELLPKERDIFNNVIAELHRRTNTTSEYKRGITRGDVQSLILESICLMRLKSKMAKKEHGRLWNALQYLAATIKDRRNDPMGVRELYLQSAKSAEGVSFGFPIMVDQIYLIVDDPKSLEQIRALANY